MKLNIGKHFNYACIRHPIVKGVVLIGVTLPLDNNFIITHPEIN